MVKTFIPSTEPARKTEVPVYTLPQSDCVTWTHNTAANFVINLFELTSATSADNPFFEEIHDTIARATDQERVPEKYQFDDMNYLADTFAGFYVHALQDNVKNNPQHLAAALTLTEQAGLPAAILNPGTSLIFTPTPLSKKLSLFLDDPFYFLKQQDKLEKVADHFEQAADGLKKEETMGHAYYDKKRHVSAGTIKWS
jgi:hypothetical protein